MVKMGGNAINNGAAVGTSATGTLVAKTTTGNHAVGFLVGSALAEEIAEVVVAPHYVA